MDLVDAFFKEKPYAIASRVKRLMREGPLQNVSARFLISFSCKRFPMTVVWLNKDQKIARDGHGMMYHREYMSHWKPCIEETITRKPDVVLDDELFFMVNPHIDENIGHALSSLLFSLQYRAVHHPGCPIVINRHKSQNIWDVLNLYVPKELIHIVESEQVIQCNRLHIPPNHFLSLHTVEGKRLALDLMGRMHSHPEGCIRGDEPMMVVLCKLENHKDVSRRPEAGVLGEKLRLALESQGWVVLDPTKLHLFRISTILSRCRACIFGSGAINYAHRRFLNPHAMMIVLFKQNSYIPGDRVGFFEDESTKHVLCLEEDEYMKNYPAFVERVTRIGELVTKNELYFGDMQKIPMPVPIQDVPPIRY